MAFYVGTNGNDTIIPGLVSSGVSFAGGPPGADNDVVIGNGGDDSLAAAGGDDLINGGDGNDTMDGGTGADRLFGSTGNDSIIDSSGDDTIDGGAGADVMVGGTGIDWLTYGGDVTGVTVTLGTGTVTSATGGHAAGDTFSGFEALAGGAGNDRLAGTNDANTIDGSTGNDTIDGANGDDSLAGGTGNDLLLGGGGNDAIVASSGADTARGEAGDDSIATGADADLVIWQTGDGNDTIDLGAGQDTLDLQGWNASDTANDAWTFALNGTTATFTGDASVGDAVLTVLNYDPTDGVACFAAGTRILTARGELPVQRLRAGDLVVTAEGGAVLKPVRWVGHSRVDVARHPRREAVAPILIRAGALADGVPARDLRVSPEHAMLLDDALVPARLLVNGSSIVQEQWCGAITYWHVELDAHGLVVAEGAVSESYYDDGNRAFFDNHVVTALLKDYAVARRNGRYAEAACRPTLDDGPRLRRIRARLAQRAGLTPPEAVQDNAPGTAKPALPRAPGRAISTPGALSSVG